MSVMFAGSGVFLRHRTGRCPPRGHPGRWHLDRSRLGSKQIWSSRSHARRRYFLGDKVFCAGTFPAYITGSLKDWGDTITVSDVNLSLSAGSFTASFSQLGCRKSTLLRLMHKPLTNLNAKLRQTWADQIVLTTNRKTERGDRPRIRCAFAIAQFIFLDCRMHYKRAASRSLWTIF